MVYSKSEKTARSQQPPSRDKEHDEIVKWPPATAVAPKALSLLVKVTVQPALRIFRAVWFFGRYGDQFYSIKKPNRSAISNRS